MSMRVLGTLGLASLAILALWLLLADPDRILGIDTGNAGMVLLMAVAWGSLYALYRLPRGELDMAISPGEWRAWIGVLFMAQLIVYLLLKSHVFVGAPLMHNPDASAVGRNVVMLLIAWAIVSQVMSDRWKGLVLEDERDREIDRVASSWGSGALTVTVIGVAVTLGITPTEKLEWAKPLMVAHVLVFCVLWGTQVNYTVAAIQYWRDRR
jgi:uncharacterized membrane protein